MALAQDANLYLTHTRPVHILTRCDQTSTEWENKFDCISEWSVILLVRLRKRVMSRLHMIRLIVIFEFLEWLWMCVSHPSDCCLVCLLPQYKSTWRWMLSGSLHDETLRETCEFTAAVRTTIMWILPTSKTTAQNIKTVCKTETKKEAERLKNTLNKSKY